MAWYTATNSAVRLTTTERCHRRPVTLRDVLHSTCSHSLPGDRRARAMIAPLGWCDTDRFRAANLMLVNTSGQLCSAQTNLKSLDRLDRGVNNRSAGYSTYTSRAGADTIASYRSSPRRGRIPGGLASLTKTW